jgi:hypothetical protein
VALEARAEDRDRRALISMMQYSMDVGCSAYWMLHSPMMPMWRTVLSAVSRSMWYSSLESVWEGAMTMESPVWTPSGSKFSMLHTVTQLSLASRTTSYLWVGGGGGLENGTTRGGGAGGAYSTSFQPSMDFSTRMPGLTDSALAAMSRSMGSSSQMPEPSPPRANALRIMSG